MPAGMTPALVQYLSTRVFAARDRAAAATLLAEHAATYDAWLRAKMDAIE